MTKTDYSYCGYCDEKVLKSNLSIHAKWTHGASEAGYKYDVICMM